nr:MAG TPA: hypothetical protein [Caudoviricetes sp.]
MPLYSPHFNFNISFLNYSSYYILYLNCIKFITTYMYFF